jgi:hypothetical protein
MTKPLEHLDRLENRVRKIRAECHQQSRRIGCRYDAADVKIAQNIIVAFARKYVAKNFVDLFTKLIRFA